MRICATLFVVFAFVQATVAQDTVQSLSLFKVTKSDTSAHETKSFYIENISVRELAKSINDELEASLDEKPKHAGVVIESPVVLVPDVRTNTLVVVANSTSMKQVAKLIEKLDKRPQQIMIRVRIQESDAEGNVTTLSEPILVTTDGRAATFEVDRNGKTLKIELNPTLVEVSE